MFKEIEQLGVLSIPSLSLLAFPSHTTSLLLQFIAYILPQYISILIPSLIPHLIITLLAMILLKIYNAKSTKTSSKMSPKTSSKMSQKTSSKLPSPDPRIVFDFIRYVTIVQTTICIFLCDFKFWPSQFSKNDEFSIGLMDLGVGCFIFVGGVISCKVSTRKTIQDAALLFLLGLVRLFAIDAFHLDVNPNEYGIHLNFYFILSIVKVIFLLINSSRNLIVGITLLIGYELFSERISLIIFLGGRSNFFLQNKEGLFSLIPFLGFFLILNSIGNLILEKDLKKIIKNGRWLFGIGLLVYFATRTYSRASRRLCNLGYLSWIFSLQFYVIVPLSLAIQRYPSLVSNFKLIEFSSHHMLYIFLFSNVLLLIFKLCLNLENLSYLSGNILNIAYLLLNFCALPKLMGNKTVFSKMKKD